MSRLACFITILLLLTASAGYSNGNSKIITIDKLRNPDWEVWVHAGYDLALMNDGEAINLLLKALKDPSSDARWHAMGFLDRYDDPRILPALKKRFLLDTEHVRNNAARTLAGMNAKYASDLFLSKLRESGDPIGKNISAQVLSDMRDIRVIPFLVQRLNDPDTRKDAALALAVFKDKRSVPALLEMLPESNNYEYTNYARENILKALIQIGDKSCIPKLMNDQKMMPAFIDALIQQGQVSQEFGQALIEPLLKIIKERPRWQQWELQDKVMRIFRNIKDPSLAPIHGKVFLESQEYSPFQGFAYILANMGTDGLPYLIAGTKMGKSYRVAFSALSSYNSGTVLYEITKLALNRLYPFRITAIDALNDYGYIWRKSVMSTLVILMRDPNPLIKLHALRIVRNLELREIRGFIQGLTKDKDQQVRMAALSILDVFAGKPPIQLEINMDKKSYGYDKPIIMEYNIKNVADYDMYVSTHGIGLSIPGIGEAIYGTAIEPTKILKSDGTSLEHKGPAVSMGPPHRDSYRILHPGDSISGQIEIMKYYEIYQPGIYTAKLGYHPFDDGIRFGIWGWWGVLASNEVTFKVKRPSLWHLMTMLGNIRISNAKEENSFLEAQKLCKKMGELNSRMAINNLKKIAFCELSDEPDPIRYRKMELSNEALMALAKIRSQKLIPDWINLLKDNDVRKREIAIDALIRLKHPMAIETLRHQIFDYSGSSSREPALELKELGDSSGIEWMTKLMLKKIKHWKPEECRNAIIALRRIHSTKGLREALTSKEPMVREEGYWWLKEVSQDMGVARLRIMLKDYDPNVKKAVAYQLAMLGDSSGLSVIKQDLDAVDSEIRQQARYAIIELQKK